jgi:glycosyltransferase involved in cell wall biosynthesis
MKVLIVSHSCVVKENQKKIKALADSGEAEITLLIPAKWKEPLRDIEAEKLPDVKYDVVASRVYYNGRILRHFYPLTLVIGLLRQRFDIIHVEEEPYSLTAFQFLALNRFISRGKTTVFTWENNFITHSFPKNIFERYVLSRADVMIAGNAEGKAVLERKGYKGPVKVLPLMGVDPERFKRTEDSELRRRLDLSELFVIGYVGRLVEEKGLMHLIDAVSRISYPVKCIFVGRGPLKEDMVERIDSIGAAGKFQFIDTVSHHDVPEYLNVMDCLVLPSISTSSWREQFGHVLIEAMACGVPVVGSSSGAIPEVVGDSGLLFREGDVEDLLDKIEVLLKRSRDRSFYIQKGRERVLDQYTHEEIANRTISIWRSSLENPLA